MDESEDEYNTDSCDIQNFEDDFFKKINSQINVKLDTIKQSQFKMDNIWCSGLSIKNKNINYSSNDDEDISQDDKVKNIFIIDHEYITKSLQSLVSSDGQAKKELLKPIVMSNEEITINYDYEDISINDDYYIDGTIQK